VKASMSCVLRNWEHEQERCLKWLAGPRSKTACARASSGHALPWELGFDRCKELSNELMGPHHQACIGPATHSDQQGEHPSYCEMTSCLFDTVLAQLMSRKC